MLARGRGPRTSATTSAATSWGRVSLQLGSAVARLDPAQLEQVVDEGRHPVRVRPDLGQEASGRGGLLERSVLERLDKPADRGERRAQLVGRVRDEVASDALHPVPLRRVVEGQHGPVRGGLGAGEGHARDGVDAADAQQLHLVLAALAGSQHVLDQGLDLALAHHLQVVAADRSVELHCLRQTRVHQDHGALVIDRQDTVVERR